VLPQEADNAGITADNDIELAACACGKIGETI
jgi:hypothetical protein